MLQVKQAAGLAYSKTVSVVNLGKEQSIDTAGQC